MTTTELDQLRRTARDFCDREVRPGARERDRTEAFPEDLVRKMVEVGFLGAAIPEEYGGMGLDSHGYQVIIEEMGAADSSIRSMLSVNMGLFGMSVLKWGTQQQKERWLPGICEGRLGAFGLTEPGAGSNPSQLESRAVKVGDVWVINGSKVYITNGSLGAVTKIFARAFDGDAELGITCFLVPQDADGYQGRQIHGKLGLRSGDTAEISMTDVHVGDDAVLGEVGGGMKVALSALDNGRFSLSAGCVGTCREALEVATTYALERTQFGRPIAGFQLVQELLAAMHVDYSAAKALVDQLAVKKESGERFTLEAATAKLFCTEAAVRNADRAVQVHGGHGYIDEYPVQRMLRDARVTTLYEGTSQIQHLIIGRQLTGISAFT
ncbi:MAG TPA: acyl-CoA dehydrogenase family protein [Nitriliruptorales bacterium]